MSGKNCNHKRKTLGYVDWFSWADAQIAKGLRQTQCDKCKLWLFPEER